MQHKAMRRSGTPGMCLAPGAHMPDSTTTWIIAAAILGVLLLAAVGVLVWRNAPGRRREKLRERFGPEYELAVQQYGSARAQRVLEARERRVEKLPLRSLSQS